MIVEIRPERGPKPLTLKSHLENLLKDDAPNSIRIKAIHDMAQLMIDCVNLRGAPFDGYNEVSNVLNEEAEIIVAGVRRSQPEIDMHRDFEAIYTLARSEVIQAKKEAGYRDEFWAMDPSGITVNVARRIQNNLDSIKEKKKNTRIIPVKVV